MSVTPTNPLHLYRALLREVSYICIPKVRQYHYEYIESCTRKRIESYEKAKKKAKTVDAKNELASLLTRQLHKGRYRLHLLQRANLGHVKALDQILREAFARTGKRRRTEITKHMAAPLTSEGKKEPMTRTWKPSDTFTNLLQNQTQVQGSLGRKHTVYGKLKPSITVPVLNKQGKPFPTCREPGLINRWYKKNADLLLLPLEEKEWLEMYELATNNKFQPGPRRTMARTTSKIAHMHEWNVDPASIGSISTQKPAEHARFSVKRLVGNPHVMTARFIQRRISRTILQTTPMVATNSETNRLASRWESGIKIAPRKIANTSQTMALFT